MKLYELVHFQGSYKNRYIPLLETHFPIARESWGGRCIVESLRGEGLFIVDTMTGFRMAWCATFEDMQADDWQRH